MTLHSELPPVAVSAPVRTRRPAMRPAKKIGDLAKSIVRPGFTSARLQALMRDAVARTGLDLVGLNVLTEAASGAYGVTPIIAALAGAHEVHAFVRPTRHGSVSEVAEWVNGLARENGVADRVHVIDTVPDALWPTLDIVTNSGHLRPITVEAIAKMPPSAVIGLMFEAWEFRDSDIDLAACHKRGVRVAGVNERHPAIDVFSFLGTTCVKMLHDAGISIYGSRIALLCDNDFGPFVMAGLTGLGATVRVFDNPSCVTSERWDAVVCALRPTSDLRVDARAAKRLSRVAPSAVFAQFWGDVDRVALQDHGVRIWPEREPARGHMGALLDGTGPEAIVRLQTGGLWAAERVFRGVACERDPIAQIL